MFKLYFALKCVYLICTHFYHLFDYFIFLLICISFILNYVNKSLCANIFDYIWGNIICDI